MLVLGAALAQALFFVLQKPLLIRYRGVEVTCYAMWSGTALALPLLPALVQDLPHADTGPILALVFLGVAPSALGFVTWAYVQARLPVATAANTLYLVPFMAIGIGWAVPRPQPGDHVAMPWSRAPGSRRPARPCGGVAGAYVVSQTTA